MKQFRIYIAIAMLMFASLACQALTGGSNDSNKVPSANESETQPGPVQPTQPSDNNDSSNSSVKTDFPLTPDAFNVVVVDDDNIVYYTKLSAEDVMKFYRDEYAARGYKERESLTEVTDGIFNMVFDGDPSGKAVVIQSVDMGDGSRTIAIRLESV